MISTRCSAIIVPRCDPAELFKMLQKKSSTRWRHFYIAKSRGMFRVRWVVDGITACAPRSSSLVRIDAIDVERLVGQQGMEVDILDHRHHGDAVMALAGQQHEVSQVAERIDPGDDLRCKAAPRSSDA